MYANIGRSLGTDYFRIADQLTGEELDYLRRTREFVDDEVLPVINGYWERAEFPWPLIQQLGKLGVVGDGIVGYGCPPMSPIATGLVHMELNRGDGSLGTFLGVQAGLAMQSIAMLGSEEQRQRWLPEMAALSKLGAFALTEPLHGSDSVALETSARRDGDEWVINGEKKWIGNGTLADVVVVWARDVADGQVKGFLVEKGTPGYAATRIDGKGSLRAVWQAQITLTDLRVPEENRLPGARTFSDTARVLAGTRNAVAWGALGHATAAYEISAAYCSQRQQFGKPLASRRVAGRIYGGAARRDPDALLHGSPARFVERPSLRGYLGQLYAITGWTSLPWLHRLRQPTLVLAGDDDPIVPLLNGRILAHRIRDARLHIVPGGGHLFLLEQPADMAALVTRFLANGH